MIEFFQNAVIQSNVPDEVKDHLMVGLQECRLEENSHLSEDGSVQRFIHGVVQVGKRQYHLNVNPMDLSVVSCEVRR